MTGALRCEAGCCHKAESILHLRYDRRHRLTSLLKKTAAGALLLAMNYSLDASGMRTGVEETDASGIVRNVAYAYDATKRLISETIDHRDDANDRIGQWTYDRVGNRLSQTVTPRAPARNTTATPTTPMTAC
jgi:hypothetical protein